MENNGALFHFTGGIESITDGKILWVKGKDCSIPVFLNKTNTWLLPMNDNSALPDPPFQIRWNKALALQEGVKVFIGGKLENKNNRLSFVSTKENPLMAVFYNCPEEYLAGELVLAARAQNEYWNSLTPASIAIGALSLIYIASSLLGRPAYRINVIAALVALFIPALPIIPPGLLFTAVFRRLAWHARKLRAYRDLALIENNPETGAKKMPVKAYLLEIAAWIILIAGVVLNIYFIFLILSLLE